MFRSQAEKKPKGGGGVREAPSLRGDARGEEVLSEDLLKSSRAMLLEEVLPPSRPYLTSIG